MIYPWNESLWKRVTGQLDKLPHALLLYGPEGGGKREFAEALAARILCEAAQGEQGACGACPSCKWLALGHHPDFRCIEPGGDEAEDTAAETESGAARKKSDQIRIAQIRALDDFLNIGTHREGYRIILIHPAEAMNATTANSLLKILEEPRPATLFLLVCNNRKRLLPTILSRCQSLHFPQPASDQALAWLSGQGLEAVSERLAHSGGMPLAAQAEGEQGALLAEFFSDLADLTQHGVLDVAGKWEGWLKENREGRAPVDRPTLVGWMQKWVFDLLLLRFTGKARFHPGQSEKLARLAQSCPIGALIHCYNDLLRIRAVARHPLNPRLFLEDMLYRYELAVRRRS